MSPLPPAYAQVLSLGVLWTSFHCAGMCGPLLCGLGIGGAGRAQRASVPRGLLGVLTYQAGRGLTYTWLGGLAGLLGAGLGHFLTAAGGILAICFGAGLVFSAVHTSRRRDLVTLRRGPRRDLVTTVLTRARGLFAPLLLSSHPLRELALGALLGFLPCMIPAWALGQAALTGSPLHGAAIMLLLVLLTTPVLLLTTQLPRLGQLFPSGLRSKIAALLPAISGLWLLLIGGAGLGLWPHHHLGVTVWGRPFLMMIF